MPVFNWPNIISGARLLLAPAVAYLLSREAYGAALTVFAAAGASDALDGYLARRLGQTTRLGAALDAAADKLMILSSVVMLAWLSLLPPWLAFTLLARDGLMLAGAMACRLAAGSLTVAPSLPGKIHTALEFVVISVVLAQTAALINASDRLPQLFVLVFLSALASGLHDALSRGRQAGDRPRTG